MPTLFEAEGAPANQICQTRLLFLTCFLGMIVQSAPANRCARPVAQTTRFGAMKFFYGWQIRLGVQTLKKKTILDPVGIPN